MKKAKKKENDSALAILFAQEEPIWNSCRTITSNLRAAYLQMADDSGRRDSFFEFPLSTRLANADLRNGNGYLLSVARAILEARVSRLCVLESNIPVAPLVSALKLLAPREASNIQFYIHVYGDFSILPDYWQALNSELEGSRLQFLCASRRQQRLVSYFLPPEASSSVAVCPFPVRCEDFRFSPEGRAIARKKLGLHQQRMIFYSGRLSLQKGILTLLSTFEKCEDEDSVLVLAGECDDISGITTGLRFGAGYFYHRLQEALSALSADTRSRIFLLGKVNTDRLRDLYSAADLFCSPSLYHDEDFGMAPAEALSSGLPSLLSDWGGYSCFAKPGVPAYLVPVSCTKRGLSLDRKELSRKWESTPALTFEERTDAGKEFSKHFSVASIASHLTRLLGMRVEEFRGFNWRMQHLRNLSPAKDGFYQEVYSNYVREA